MERKKAALLRPVPTASSLRCKLAHGGPPLGPPAESDQDFNLALQPMLMVAPPLAIGEGVKSEETLDLSKLLDPTPAGPPTFWKSPQLRLGLSLLFRDARILFDANTV